MEDGLRILAVLGLIAANAFFVVGEYAVVTARRSAVQALATGGRRGAAAALRLMDDPVRVISTVQVGITALGILTGAVGEPLVREVLPEAMPSWSSFVIAFAIVTYLSVVLGELVPKALTLDRAERLATIVARPVELMAIVLKPVVAVLQWSAQIVLKPFGVSEVVAGDSIRSPEELRAIVDEAEGTGIIREAEEEMIYRVFDFAGREARDIMVPAADVAWLDAEQPVHDALHTVVDRPYSRYPVAEGSLNSLCGVVHVRDLVAASIGDGDTVKRASRPAIIVPETKDIAELMRELREEHQHMAVVVDEYGGTAGIVTLENILEELVGEIEDEYDAPSKSIERVDDRTIRVAGAMTIDDFNEAVGAHFSHPHVHTLAGIVIDALGRAPLAGDSVTIDDVRLTVEEVERARITQLAVELPEE